MQTCGQLEKGNTLCWERIQSLTNLFKHTKIYFLLSSLVFRRFLWLSKMVHTKVHQCWGTPSTSKSMNRVGSIPISRNSHFSRFVYRVRYLKKTLFDYGSNRLLLFKLNLTVVLSCLRKMYLFFSEKENLTSGCWSWKKFRIYLVTDY